MCGFVGFRSETDFKRLSEDMPEAVSSLAHRGPDDTGLFFDAEPGVGLGHRRLSVIDLSAAGRQPMKSDDGSVHIVYNGEVYNFKKIRETLERHGHRFHTATDTEVILKAYLQWGIDCLQRFVGMFALAIWDRPKRQLFLARDRLGIKPLYYCFIRGAFLFSSELKGIMAFECFNREIDPEALPLFLHYQYIPAPRTIFKDTYKLLPGHYAIFDGHRLYTHPYWQLSTGDLASKSPGLSEEDALEELDHLLTGAVSDRLISDVPLGALLSGGIDSSAVVALMQKVNSSPVRTFSIGFREPGYDEAPWASKVARHLGTDHTEFYVTPREAMEIIPKLPEMYDEPFADSSAIPSFLVCCLARSHVTVALSGDGGDEQFCGYVRYWSTQSVYNSFQRLPKAIKAALALSLRGIPSHWAERSYSRWSISLPKRFRVANFPDKWQKLVAMMGRRSLSSLYRSTVCLWSKDEIFPLVQETLPEGVYEETFRKTEGWPILSRLMRVDQTTYLPDAMLTKVDRASMANSLEVRVPLLDHRVVEYTSRLPDSLKYRNGTGKYILKKLLARYVPAGLFERPKMGFGVPIDRWFRDDLKALLLDYLSSDRLRKEGIFDQTLVEKKIKEHLSGHANHQYRLWSLLMWEMWRERWLNGS
ncbi:MAG: asparagine synthase (glutamine-hydrolyzing) [Desulfobacterales bacterium]|nr:asparagine synthase (glutamine-hydrolyzing) [Desulfobacterales bacterium]